MSRLSELIRDISCELICGSADTEIKALVTDSRKLEEGCLFTAVKGLKFDGHSALPQAIEAGAAALLAEDINDELKTLCEEKGVALVRTTDTREALCYVSAAWFGYPAKSLATIGITGTKGKTTTTYLVRSALEALGYGCGLVGTVEVDTGKRKMHSVNTTPGSFELQSYMAEMRDAGLKAMVMEVSSQGLKMHRTDGIRFDAGVFTNLSPDHIAPGEHEDLEDYISCKALLFSQCVVGCVNGDDGQAERMLRDNTCDDTMSFGLSPECDIYASGIKLEYTDAVPGVSFMLEGLTEKAVSVTLPFPGRFSVYNILAAISAVYISLEALGEKRSREETLPAVIEGFRKTLVPGRIELLPVSDEYAMMIDYAHNAMALESLLKTIREYSPGRIVTLFGCGGNRAKSRRYEMGEASGKLSDLTIITSDNPRDEEPEDIIADIITGMKKTGGEYVTITDRKEAIAWGMHNAKPGDILILAGKGHEDYQEIKGVKHHMDERQLVLQILKEDGNTEAFERMAQRYPDQL